MQKILLIGYGSIGQRHEKNLSSLGLRVGIVSRRQLDKKDSYFSLEEAIQKFAPDLYLVCNETYLHLETVTAILRLTSNKSRILVEKPLFDKVSLLPKDAPVSVAYHLRFHPLMDRLRARLENQKIVSYYSYVGQYLPTWRPDRDYTQSYSAHKEQGGGVLRDLSHELDLAQFFLGPMKSLYAFGGKFSDLKISSDDHFSLLSQYAKCALASISMNYTDQVPQRAIKVITEQDTFNCDLINGTITNKSGSETIFADRNDAYLGMLKAFASGSDTSLCSLTEGLNVLHQIEAAEKSSLTGARINL